LIFSLHLKCFAVPQQAVVFVVLFDFLATFVAILPFRRRQQLAHFLLASKKKPRQTPCNRRSRRGPYLGMRFLKL